MIKFNLSDCDIEQVGSLFYYKNKYGLVLACKDIGNSSQTYYYQHIKNVCISYFRVDSSDNPNPLIHHHIYKDKKNSYSKKKDFLYLLHEVEI